MVFDRIPVGRGEGGLGGLGLSPGPVQAPSLALVVLEGLERLLQFSELLGELVLLLHRLLLLNFFAKDARPEPMLPLALVFVVAIDQTDNFTIRFTATDLRKFSGFLESISLLEFPPTSFDFGRDIIKIVVVIVVVEIRFDWKSEVLYFLLLVLVGIHLTIL